MPRVTTQIQSLGSWTGTTGADAALINNVDTTNANSVEFSLNGGVTTGTFNGTNFLEIKLQESDTTTAGDYSDVAKEDILLADGSHPDADGVLLSVKASIAAGSEVTVLGRYLGMKKYVRLYNDRTGSSVTIAGSANLFTTNPVRPS